MANPAVLRSELIETLSEARDYYAKLVGDHKITVGGQLVTIRFDPVEIHPFTEGIKTDSTPPESSLVRRADRSGEVRKFSRHRARHLDAILPTLEKPSGCVAAKSSGALQVFGPVDSAGKRMAVIINYRQGVYVVRTAYPIDSKTFTNLVRANRRQPWPPK